MTRPGLSLTFDQPIVGEDADVIYKQIQYLHTAGHTLEEIGLFAQLMTTRRGRRVVPRFTCAEEG